VVWAGKAGFDERRRIVAKVDQLMSLCDELESKLTAARERAERLVGAMMGVQG